MKRFLILISCFTLLSLTPGMACEVCKQQQPEALQDITHGAGPAGEWDYIIIISAAVIVAVTLILSIKYLMKPGEKSPGHIKNIVIDNY